MKLVDVSSGVSLFNYLLVF